MGTQQLVLNLKGRGWQQAGPGRPRGKRAKVAHRRRDEVAASCPVHVTIRVKEDVPRLRCGRFVRAFRQMLIACGGRDDFRVVHHSVQHNHVHLLIEAKDKLALANGMNCLNSRIARGINRIFNRTGGVFHGRYHVRAVKTPREVRNALAYVLLNHRHHREANCSGIDRASSGAWFTGWKDAFPTPPNRPCEVSPPRTWLLTVGWRKHPLISVTESPG